MNFTKPLAALLGAAALLTGCCQNGCADGNNAAADINEATVASEKAVDYDTYFENDRMRIDFSFAGDRENQYVFLEGLAREIEWSGSRKNLIDFGFGGYRLEVISVKDSTLIFTKGFQCLFDEWLSTPEATTTPKAFKCSHTIPYPKDSVQIRILKRDKKTGFFHEKFSSVIDPADKSINREQANQYRLVPIIENGDVKHKVDLLFIAEGYTEAEMDLFLSDARRFAGYLFEMEPYKSRQSDFNIWALCSPSAESGVDIPHENVWKNTVVNSSFYTFYVDRYLTAPNQSDVAKVASNAPYDALYVIANTDKYGGGGIYNFYGLSMRTNVRKKADGQIVNYEDEVFVHEFGHSFAGLADEYYADETGFDEEVYCRDIEPWEPNLTTLVDFDSKWKDLLPEGTPVPTPVTDESKLLEIGVFEGGGYMAKGVYRPAYNCRMKINDTPFFCPVCRRAIERMIDFYTE